jgi:dTDP-4-dehydrorhamnose 3,5-epimerase
MSRFTSQETPIEDLKIIERKAIEDERGFLSRLFCSEELLAHGWSGDVKQINHTLTRDVGVVRGMHYQIPPKAEAKLVSCIRGAVWDVALDLRKNSPTFLKWHAQEISVANKRAMLIPAGFAHGFQSLTTDCELIYLHSEAYDPVLERGLMPLDPILKISWPLQISSMSQRDLNHPLLDENFEGLAL